MMAAGIEATNIFIQIDKVSFLISHLLLKEKGKSLFQNNRTTARIAPN